LNYFRRIYKTNDPFLVKNPSCESHSHLAYEKQNKENHHFFFFFKNFSPKTCAGTKEVGMFSNEYKRSDLLRKKYSYFFTFPYEKTPTLAHLHRNV